MIENTNLLTRLHLLPFFTILLDDDLPKNLWIDFFIHHSSLKLRTQSVFHPISCLTRVDNGGARRSAGTGRLFESLRRWSARLDRIVAPVMAMI